MTPDEIAFESDAHDYLSAVGVEAGDLLDDMVLAAAVLLGKSLCSRELASTVLKDVCLLFQDECWKVLCWPWARLPESPGYLEILDKAVRLVADGEAETITDAVQSLLATRLCVCCKKQMGEAE